MISKLMLLEQVTIQEKKQQLLNKGISNEIIDKLLQADPTNKDKSDNDKVGSYTDWIVSMYLKDRQFDNFEQLYNQLEQYDKSKRKLPNKEQQSINYFNSLTEFITFVKQNHKILTIASDTFNIIEKTGYDEFDSTYFRIIVPHTREQSIENGSGTKWCTAQINDNMFDDYYKHGYLFYIFSKTTNQKKYNLFLNTDDKYEIEFADGKDRHLTYKLFDIVKQDTTLLLQIKKYINSKQIELATKSKNLINRVTVSGVVNFWIQRIDPLAALYYETDEEVLIDKIKIYYDAIKYIPNPSVNVQIQQVTQTIKSLRLIDSPHKETILQQVTLNGNQIQYILHAGLKVDKDIMMQQVRQDGDQIEQILQAKLQIDKDIMKQQVSQCGNQIKYILYAKLQIDKDIMMQQVRQDGDQVTYILKYKAQIEVEEKDLYDIMMQQVTQNGGQIYYILYAKLQIDKDIMMQQVKQNGMQIKYILQAGLKVDREIMMQQVKQNGMQIKYILQAGLKVDREIMMQQVKQNGMQIKYILQAGLKVDREIMMQQVSNIGLQIRYILYYGLKVDREIMMQQVSQNGHQIEYILKYKAQIEVEEKDLYDIMMQQVLQNGRQIQYIHNPTEEVQLQQIKQASGQYYDIENATPNQRLLFRQLRGFTESTTYINKLLDVM